LAHAYNEQTFPELVQYTRHFRLRIRPNRSIIWAVYYKSASIGGLTASVPTIG